MITTPLIMHYAPDVLVVLKRHLCPDPHHTGDLGCERPTHQYFTIAALTLLAKDEKALPQCRIKTA